jgi:hypothetical protein
MVALRRHPLRCRACQCRFYKYRYRLRKHGGGPADDPIAPRDSGAA